MRAQKEKRNNQEGRHAGLPLRRGVPMCAPGGCLDNDANNHQLGTQIVF
jgi:hypothetical protein